MIACASCKTPPENPTPRNHPDFRHCPVCRRGTLCFDYAAGATATAPKIPPAELPLELFPDPAL